MCLSYNNAASLARARSTRWSQRTAQFSRRQWSNLPEAENSAPGAKLTPDLIRFPDSGHFFHGKLVDLKEVAASRLP